MKKLFYILSLFVFITSLNAKHAKTLHLVTLNAVPLEYLEDGEAKGVNVDIVRETLKRMGYEVKIEFYPWKRALAMVENAEVDGIIDAAYSEERAKYLYYPEEDIYAEKWYAFKRKDSNITLDKDFSNAKDIVLGITRGFHYGGKIQKAIDSKKFKRFEIITNNTQNLKKLYAKRFDMFVGLRDNTLILAEKLGYAHVIDIVKMSETAEEYLLSSSKTYLGFSKHRISEKLTEDFSKTLSQMKKDGTVKKIYKKYYSKLF